MKFAMLQACMKFAMLQVFKYVLYVCNICTYIAKVAGILRFVLLS